MQVTTMESATRGRMLRQSRPLHGLGDTKCCVATMGSLFSTSDVPDSGYHDDGHQFCGGHFVDLARGGSESTWGEAVDLCMQICRDCPLLDVFMGHGALQGA